MATLLSAPVIVFRNVHNVTVIKAKISFVLERSCNSESGYNELCAFVCTVEKLYDFGLEPAKNRYERF